jgi:UDP-2,3-diacylglucosamine hydrolase
MPIFFLSDVHLGHDSPEKEVLKLERLDGLFELVASEGKKLYILGDLFDFWFEYKHAIPKSHLNTLFKLQRLIDAGVSITYITGNHDFWLGDLLSTQLGIDVIRDETVVEHQGKRILLIHGDGLARSDGAYRFLKRVLRNPMNVFLYRLIPPDIGIPFALRCSRTSRKHSSKRPQDEFLQEYRDFAERKLAEGLDAVVCAHTHYPELIEFDNGIYVNTGDWIDNFTYVTLDGGVFELKRWQEDRSRPSPG